MNKVITTLIILISTIASSQEMLLKKDVIEQQFGKIVFYRYKIIEKVENNDNGSVKDEKGKPLNGHCNIADTRGNYIDVHFKKGKKHGEEIKYDYNQRKLSMRSYVDGKKTGKFESYFTDGSVKVKGEHLDGLQNGKWEYFEESGKVKEYETYNKGRKNGKWWKKRRSSYGYYIVTGSYENDIPVGVWTEKWEEGKEKQRITYKGKGTYTKKEYYSSGELKNQETYKDFKLDGVHLSYSKANILLDKTTYRNGLLVKQERFYDTGRPRDFFTKKNGKYHGKFISYKRTGVKDLEGEYKDGNKTGLWKNYIGDEGRLKFEVNYKNDIQHGFKKVYNRSKLEYEGNYIKGERDGLWKWYKSDGKIENEITYKLGKSLSEIRKSYHRNGVLREIENYVNSKLEGEQFIYSKAKVVVNKKTYKKGELIKEESFFDTGRPHKMYTKKNGNYNGDFVIYTRSGAKEKEGAYLNGNKTGLWKRYSGNEGYLIEELNFKDDFKNGLAKTYFNSGKVEYQGDFKNGQKNGVWKWYNQRGKLVKESEYEIGREMSSKTFK